MQRVATPQRGRKIVLLISSMNAGGAERVAAALVNSWVELGHEVRVVPCFSQGTNQSFYPQILGLICIGWLMICLVLSCLAA